jgi:hypothetical protein
MLMHQLALALYHTSMVLQNKSLFYHPFKYLKVLGLQNIGQTIIQTIQETLLLLLINVYLVGSITRELGETGDILIH